MKMPEKHEKPPFSRQRNKASGQSLRLQWRTFAADIMAVRLQKQRCVYDAKCARYRAIHSFLSTSPDQVAPDSLIYYITCLSATPVLDSIGNLAYITSVAAIGTDYWFGYQTLRC